MPTHRVSADSRARVKDLPGSCPRERDRPAEPADNAPVTRKHGANLVWVGLGALLAISGMFGLYLGLFSAGTLVWPMLLFEPIVVGAGLITIAVGLGRQRSFVPMALATAAGCVGVAAFLSTVAGRNTLGGGLLVPMLGLRLAIAGVLALWAAWLVLGPDTKAWRRVVLGGILLLLGGGIAAIGFAGPAKPIRDVLLSMGGFVASAAALVLFVVFVILVSAGVHLLVRPFEIALDSGKAGSGSLG